MPLHKIEIKHYKYSIRPGGQTGARAWLSLHDETELAIGHAQFVRDEDVPAPIGGDGKVMMIFEDSDFARVIDLLRNEKPVYLVYFVEHDEVQWAQLSTDAEPVGEEERSD